ncbi:MAG: hypothetical protein KW804_01650 [Candidatus Doudnabacteria bacterium]|nr:hypothetical protein [Candidatus Doudnabacteria bacterium]
MANAEVTVSKGTAHESLQRGYEDQYLRNHGRIPNQVRAGVATKDHDDCQLMEKAIDYARGKISEIDFTGGH